MPELTIDLPARQGGKREKQYPYEQWLNGNVWLLVRGQEYNSTTASIRSSLVGEGKSRGMKVATRGLTPEIRKSQKLPADCEGIIIQAAPK